MKNKYHISQNFKRLMDEVNNPQRLLAKNHLGSYDESDLSKLKALLAHSSLSVTEKYMGNFDTSKTDAALAKAVSKEDEESKLLHLLEGVNPEVLKKVMEKLTDNQGKG